MSKVCTREKNPIEFLFVCAKSESGITDAEISDKMGYARGVVNRKIHREASRWSLGDIADFTVALSVPKEEVINAFAEWLGGLYG